MTLEQSNKSSYQSKTYFHQREISFIGISNSGKTTLVCSLLKIFQEKKMSVAYIKSDAHNFSMDKEGKDTFKASSSGASQAFIQNDNKSALISNVNSKDDFLLNSYKFIDNDFVLIEGFKKSDILKVIVLDDDFKILKMIEEYQFKKVLCIVGTQRQISKYKEKYHKDDIQLFNRDEVLNISNFIVKYFSKIVDSEIVGLILGGGYSRRMGKDKALLKYHDFKNQLEYCTDLFNQLNIKSFISCRESQKDLYQKYNSNLIFDQIKEMGPMGGIFSALKISKKAVLVLACDIPFIEKSLLEKLIQKRNPYKIATCFFNPERNWREPLIAIYEPMAASKIAAYFGLDKTCPRRMLRNSNVESIELLASEVKQIRNINSVEDL